MAEAFSTGCARILVCHYGCQIFDVKDSHWAGLFEVLGVLPLDWRSDGYFRHQTVEGSAHRAPLRMSFANALFTNEVHLDLLTRAHFSYENVVQQWSDVSQALLLVTFGNPLQIARIDVTIVVQLLFVMNSVVQN